MLTKQDLREIGAIVDERLEAKLEEKLEAKLEEKLEAKLEEKLEAKLEEKLGRYPTKDEFYTAMDQLMTELKAIREEQAALTFRVSDHEERITALEKTSASA